MKKITLLLDETDITNIIEGMDKLLSMITPETDENYFDYRAIWSGFSGIRNRYFECKLNKNNEEE